MLTLCKTTILQVFLAVASIAQSKPKPGYHELDAHAYSRGYIGGFGTLGGVKGYGSGLAYAPSYSAPSYSHSVKTIGVPVGYAKPYPVPVVKTIARQVPVPVVKTIAEPYAVKVPVDQPYAVPVVKTVAQPYPVYKTVYRDVPEPYARARRQERCARCCQAGQGASAPTLCREGPRGPALPR